MAGLIDELRERFRGQPDCLGASHIRRRWIVLPLRISPPVDENGILVVHHPHGCMDRNKELTCSPQDCRASLGFVSPVAVDDGEGVSIFSGLADFFSLAVGERSAQLDQVANDIRERAKSAERQYFLVGSEPLDCSADPVSKALDVVGPHLDALRLATGHWFPSLTHEQLFEVYLTIEDQLDGLLGDPVVSFVAGTRVEPRKDATPEQIATAERLAFWTGLDDPTIAVQELVMGSHHDLHVTGDYQSAVLKAATAVEMAVAHMSKMVEWEATDRPARLPRAIRGAKPLDLIERVLSKRIDASDWDHTIPTSPLGGWRVNVARLRNRIVHQGHRPTCTEADRCWEATVCALAFLREALANRCHDFPWSSLKWSTFDMVQAGTHSQVEQQLVLTDGSQGSAREVHERWLSEYLAASGEGGPLQPAPG